MSSVVFFVRGQRKTCCVPIATALMQYFAISISMVSTFLNEKTNKTQLAEMPKITCESELSDLLAHSLHSVPEIPLALSFVRPGSISGKG
jgi:hypothetical protein